MERGARKVAGRQRAAEIKNKRERWEGGRRGKEGRKEEKNGRGSETNWQN